MRCRVSEAACVSKFEREESGGPPARSAVPQCPSSWVKQSTTSPLVRLTRMQPRDQTSILKSYFIPRMTSGAR